MVCYLNVFAPCLLATEQGTFLSYTIIVPLLYPRIKMAREKTYKIRFSEKEWQRLEQEARAREVPASQVIRDLLKTLDKEVNPVST